MKALNTIKYPRMFKLERTQEERQYDESNQFRLNQNFRNITDAIVVLEESVESLPAKLLADVNVASDYVVAGGEDGNWLFRKWNSGIAECWCSSVDISKSVTTATGALYYAEHSLSLPPSLFTSVKIANVTPLSSAVLVFVSMKEISNTAVLLRVGSTASALISFKLQAHVIGKWKE